MDPQFVAAGDSKDTPPWSVPASFVVPKGYVLVSSAELASVEAKVDKAVAAVRAAHRRANILHAAMWMLGLVTGVSIGLLIK